MASYKELLAQKRELDAQIEAFKRESRADALKQARDLVQAFGLSATEVFANAKRTVAPRYRDPATGATWTGRGKAPLWIAGKDRSAFAIAQA